MPFCKVCGKKLSADAKICPECGTAMLGEDQQTHRTFAFEGEIRKCPNCGEHLSSFDVKCRACGIELRNVKSSKAVQDFYSKIVQIEAERGKRKPGETEKSIANIIRSYPIPNSKEDVLEFMLLAASNIDPSLYSASGDKKKSEEYQAQKMVNDAWYATFEQVYHKSELSFGDDSSFSKIKQLYNKKVEEILCSKRQGVIKDVFSIIANFFRSVKSLLMCFLAKSKKVIVTLLPFLIMGSLLVFLFVYLDSDANRKEEAHNSKEKQLEAIVVEIQECIEAGDYDSAIIKAQSLYMDDDYSIESKSRWDEVRKDLIAMIETKSGISYTSDSSFFSTLEGAFVNATEAVGEGIDMVTDFFQDTFSSLFE